MLLNCGVGEDSCESLGHKEIKPVHPKGNQSWIIIGRTEAEAEAEILWPPDVKNWLTGKDPDAGKDWREEEKRTINNEMIGWHHQLHGHKFVQALGVGDGQENLACCSPWGHKESDMTEWLNWISILPKQHKYLSAQENTPMLSPRFIKRLKRKQHNQCTRCFKSTSYYSTTVHLKFLNNNKVLQNYNWKRWIWTL